MWLLSAGMDISVRKPLIASCSTDKSIRLWNYHDRTCELVKWFPDDIFSIAIHPTGLQVRTIFLILILFCISSELICLCSWRPVGRLNEPFKSDDFHASEVTCNELNAHNQSMRAGLWQCILSSSHCST
jgi:WD40 repeat protein